MQYIHTKFIPHIHLAPQHPSFDNLLAKKIVGLFGKFVAQLSERTDDFIPSKHQLHILHDVIDDALTTHES